MGFQLQKARISSEVDKMPPKLIRAQKCHSFSGLNAHREAIAPTKLGDASWSSNGLSEDQPSSPPLAKRMMVFSSHMHIFHVLICQGVCYMSLLGASGTCGLKQSSRWLICVFLCEQVVRGG